MIYSCLWVFNLAEFSKLGKIVAKIYICTTKLSVIVLGMHVDSIKSLKLIPTKPKVP